MSIPLNLQTEQYVIPLSYLPGQIVEIFDWFSGLLDYDFHQL